jgi:hypothetical protein
VHGHDRVNAAAGTSANHKSLVIEANEWRRYGLAHGPSSSSGLSAGATPSYICGSAYRRPLVLRVVVIDDRSLGLVEPGRIGHAIGCAVAGLGCKSGRCPPTIHAPSTAALFAGLDRADSVTVDVHKWLGMQNSCSLVLLRTRGALAAAFHHDDAYLPHEADAANPVDRTLEYSRPIRSLTLWLAFRTYGADAFRSWIERTLGHARALADAVDAEPSFSCCAARRSPRSTFATARLTRPTSTRTTSGSRARFRMRSAST